MSARQPADHLPGVADRSEVVGGDEQDRQIRRLVAERLEHLTGDLAHGVGGERVLGEGRGERHRPQTGGRRVRGTTVTGPPSMLQWASMVP